MPFVSRPIQPSAYNPINLPNLIAHYNTLSPTSVIIGPGNNPLIPEASNIIKIIDETPYNNNLVASPDVSCIPLGPTAFPFFFSNSFLINNPTEMRYQTNGVTVFFVGFLGTPIFPTDLISIFGTSNSPLVSAGNAAFLRIDSNNYLYATNGINNAGANTLLVNDYNVPKIITGVFDKTNSILRINGNNYGVSNCVNTFVGGYDDYVIQIGTPNNLYNLFSPVDTSINTNIIFEVLVYNSALTYQEYSRIEEYLVEKWGPTFDIPYPDQDYRTYSNVMQIPHLCLWLNPTRSNITFNNPPDNTRISYLYSSDNLSNTFRGDGTTATYPVYNINDKRISFDPTDGRSPLFPNGAVPIIPGTGYDLIGQISVGMGNIYGLTTFTLLSSKSLPDSGGNIATILAAFTPQDPNLLDETVYPTILQDKLGNIYIGSNIFDTAYSVFPFNMGINNTVLSYSGEGLYLNQPFLLTTQFTESNTQMWVNGYPLPPIQTPPLISNNILSYLTYDSNQSLGCYIGGVPAIPTPANGYQTCSTEIGEVLIYKKALSTAERNIVNTHIFSNYNISPNISSNGLIGWWDANDISGVDISANIWTSKYDPNMVLSNFSPTTRQPYVRGYVNPITNNTHKFMDLNNGLPSFMTCDIPDSLPPSTDLTIFMVTTGSYTSNNAVALVICNPSDLGAPLINVIGGYNDITSRTVMRLGANSTTELNNGNLFYISTYSIVNNLSQNIFSIPAGSPNYLTDDSIPFDLSNNTIHVGGVYDPINDFTSYFKNSIGELIIYNRALSTGEYTNILAHLQSKWEFPVKVKFSFVNPTLWYDANDLPVNTSTWTSHAGYFGPVLDLSGSISGSISVITSNENQFLDMGHLNAWPLSSPNVISINQDYTFFVVSKPNTSNGAIVTISPAVDRTFNYPGLYFSNDRYMIVSGSDLPFTNSDECYSQCMDLSAIDLRDINITCINHSFNTLLNQGSYKIRSKGTVYEKSASNVYEPPFSPGDNSNLTLTIGGLTPSNVSYNGLIGEFIFYDRSLNDLEVLSAFKYLEGKWLNGGGPNTYAL